MKDVRRDDLTGGVLVQPTVELADGTWERPLADIYNIPFFHPFERIMQVDPVLIPAAEGILWNPGAAFAERYDVCFLIVNIDPAGAAQTVRMGVDRAAGGALATFEYWIFNEVIPYPGSSGWRGPFHIPGDDDIRGWSSLVNTLAVHWRIVRTDRAA